MNARRVAIPEAIEAEHRAILEALAEAALAPGAVGAAARELAAVLQPHFVREEEIALPPLKLLAQLARDEGVPEAVLAETLAMADALKVELPAMLKEHSAIDAAVWKLRAAAFAEDAQKYERLAEQLALLARAEEDVLYPAAVLVGEIIRARRGR